MSLSLSYNSIDIFRLNRCSSRHVPRRYSANSRVVFRQRRSRRPARASGSRSPATMARMIPIPVTPAISLTARCACTFIWSRAFCMRCTQRVRASIRLLHSHINARSAQICWPGRKEPRSRPQACSNWIHWQSCMSVLRAGTLDSCLALASNTSKPFAYTLVLSMATDSIP